jgi:hypothetical protein
MLGDGHRAHRSPCSHGPVQADRDYGPTIATCVVRLPIERGVASGRRRRHAASRAVDGIYEEREHDHDG